MKIHRQCDARAHVHTHTQSHLSRNVLESIISRYWNLKVCNEVEVSCRLDCGPYTSAELVPREGTQSICVWKLFFAGTQLDSFIDRCLLLLLFRLHSQIFRNVTFHSGALDRRRPSDSSAGARLISCVFDKTKHWSAQMKSTNCWFPRSFVRILKSADRTTQRCLRGGSRRVATFHRMQMQRFK